jgi:hypothetical protein
LTKARRVDDETVEAINFIDPVDNVLLHALQDPRVNIAVSAVANLLAPLEQLSPGRLSRQLRRSRDIGVTAMNTSPASRVKSASGSAGKATVSIIAGRR